MYIQEIAYIDEILEFEKKKELSDHIQVTNVSYWNSSDLYKEYLKKHIRLDIQKDIFDYVYTYDVQKKQREKILKKLGIINPESSMCLLTTTGTNSILNAINFLKLHNYKKIAIMIPSYFSVERCCQIYNIEYKKIILQYCDGQYFIPYEYILNNKFDAIWITSPPYSTGTPFDDSQIDILKKIISNQILVIADESLALPHQMLETKIPISDYFFSICSPHKALFINKIKFSALICPLRYDDFLEQWIDIIGGNLLLSNITAIHHFLSDNYEECLCASKRWYSDSVEKIREILTMFPNAECNLSDISPYKTIFIKHPLIDIQSLKHIKELISNNYISYIPTKLGDHMGFRINLSLDPNTLTNALYRIIDFYN